MTAKTTLLAVLLAIGVAAVGAGTYLLTLDASSSDGAADAAADQASNEDQNDDRAKDDDAADPDDGSEDASEARTGEGYGRSSSRQYSAADRPRTEEESVEDVASAPEAREIQDAENASGSSNESSGLPDPEPPEAPCRTDGDRVKCRAEGSYGHGVESRSIPQRKVADVTLSEGTLRVTYSNGTRERIPACIPAERCVWAPNRTGLEVALPVGQGLLPEFSQEIGTHRIPANGTPAAGVNASVDGQLTVDGRSNDTRKADPVETPAGTLCPEGGGCQVEDVPAAEGDASLHCEAHAADQDEECSRKLSVDSDEDL